MPLNYPAFTDVLGAKTCVTEIIDSFCREGRVCWTRRQRKREEKGRKREKGKETAVFQDHVFISLYWASRFYTEILIFTRESDG